MIQRKTNMPNYRNSLVLFLFLIGPISCKFSFLNGTAVPVTATEPLTLSPATDTPLAAGTSASTSLNPTGPYVMYAGSSGVWISNPDGSFMTRLTTLAVERDDLHRLISPRGDRMALIALNDQGIDLVEIKIPSGETKTITRLYSMTSAEVAADPKGARAIAYYALANYQNVTWQPGEGRLLAFMGALDGPTSDLYLYDTQSGEIIKLTDGPFQAVFPNWSPDGQYVLHYGVSYVEPFGGPIGGHTRLDGVWAVRVADRQIITQPTPQGIHLSFVGWQDAAHYITYDSDGTSHSQNLRSVDVVSGAVTSLMGFSFDSEIARCPENGALLFSSKAGYANSPGDGVFLLLPGQTTPTRLSDKSVSNIFWVPENRAFQAYAEGLYSADGTAYDPPVYGSSYQAAISQKGYQAWEVIENQQGRLDLRVPGGNWQTILAEQPHLLIWDPASGETLLIVLNDGSFYAAASPDFTPRLLGNIDNPSQVVWVP